MTRPDEASEIEQLQARRRFIKGLAVGATAVVIGGVAYAIGGPEADAAAERALRHDGKRRLPPGQRVLVEKPPVEAPTEPIEPVEPLSPVEPPKPELIRVDATTKGRDRLPPGQKSRSTLKPMGGKPGNTSRAAVRLKIHGEVENETVLTFDQLLEMQLIEQKCDVHCVTGWSLLGGLWKGVRVSELAALAGPTKRARHVIFEAAHGYTANVPLDEATAPNVLVAWEFNGNPLEHPNGPPMRSLVPDLYFWKSAKWLTGIRFVERDQPGYWETRGYHNHADPWTEERDSND